tara:strand:+ start:1020 stop:1361 length:342 start_codon:yes stop_codon:yes gene_type:complete
MGSINASVLGHDLNFLINETGKEFVGVSPAALTDKVFKGSFNSLDESYDVMLHGHEVTIDAEIILNGKEYETLPTKGTVLKDRDGNEFKAVDVKREDFGPAYVVQVIAKYQRG